MAVYKTDFSEYSLSAQPSDWTERWHTGVAVAQVAGAGDYGGKSLWLYHTSNNRYAVSWDDCGAALTDVDALCKFRVEDSASGMARLVARGSGGDSDETGFFVDVHSDTNEIELWYYSGGSATQIGSAYSATINTGTEYFLRLNVSGAAGSVSVKASVWECGSAQPSWQLNETSAASISSGWVGVGSYRGSSGGGVYYDWFAVSDSGDAPFPPVAEPGSGTANYATQAPGLSFLSPGPGAATYAGLVPSYLNGILAQPPAGSASIAGQVPTFVNNITIPVPTRQARLAGFAPTFLDNTIAAELPLLEVAAVANRHYFGFELPLFEVEAQTGENAGVACELPLLSPALYSGAQAAVELPLLTPAATAEVGIKADASCVLPLLQTASQGGALCSAELPLFTVDAEADAETLCQTSCALPLLKPALTADNERLAEVACSLPLLQPALTTAQTVQADVACALPLLKAALAGESGELAEMACSLPLLDVSGGIVFEPLAEIACPLPLLAMGGYYPSATATVAGRFDDYLLRYRAPT